MFWTPILILGLCRLSTLSLAQFVYTYDAESNGPPQSDLFNPSSFRYVPPSAIRTESGNNYVGRATTTSGRARESSANLPVAGSRPFATASEYFHPTSGGNSVSLPEYEPPQPAPTPRRTYEVPRAYEAPPPPQPQYEVAQAAPQRYQIIPHAHDEFERSRQQLYADQPSHNNPLQYIGNIPQTHQNTHNFQAPFSSYQNFRHISPPQIVHRPAPANVFNNFQDVNSGPAQDSFFRSVGQPIYRPAPQPQPQPQPIYRPAIQPQPQPQPYEPYQYSYRHPYPEAQFEELQPESPPSAEYQQPPEDNQIQEAPTPAPTRPPQRQRTRARSRSRPVVAAYEPAPTPRPQRQYTPPREEYVAPRPQRRPDPVTEAPPRRGTTHRPASIGVASLPPDVDNDGIPGEGGVDYPILSSVPRTSFSCAKQPISGYYADLETACQVVHSCQSGGIQHSFLCPNGTVFNQDGFSCQWWYRVDCKQASQYYALNDNLYRTTEAPRRRAPPPPSRRPTEAPLTVVQPQSQQQARRPARPAVEQPRPRPVVEQPRPRPVVEQPRPRPVVEQPRPRPVVEQPTPRPVVEQPRPRPVVEEPDEDVVRRPVKPSYESERDRNLRRRERQRQGRAQQIEADLRNANRG